MIATDFWGCTDCPEQVWTQFYMRWRPHEQIAWWWRVTLPEAAAMPQTERLAGDWIHRSVQTLLHFLQGRLVVPRGHNAPGAVCRVDEHPATAVKHGTGPGQINLIALDSQQACLPQQDIGSYGTVNGLMSMVGGNE
jgi:hypothetical protein